MHGLEREERHARRRLTWAAAVTISAAMTAPTLADVTDMKPGLWETVNHHADGKSERSTQCVSDEVMKLLRQLREKQLQGPDPSCKVLSDDSKGAVSTSDIECHVADVSMRTHTVTTRNGSESYHTESHVTASGPTGKKEETGSSDVKYLGVCPAGMEPGDTIMPDGKKFNYLKIMGLHRTP